MNFCLCLPLLGPLPVSAPLHLDGLIHALMVREGLTSPDRVNLPLDEERGVYRASAAFFLERAVPVTERHTVTGILGWNAFDEFVELANDPKKASRMKNLKPGGNELRVSSVVQAEAVVFYGSGDAEWIGEFLRENLEGLGKNRLCPVDREKISLFPMREDRSWVVDGEPARAIPLDLWKTVDGAGEDPCRAMVSFRPPYWKTEKRLCAVSPGRGRILSSLELLGQEWNSGKQNAL